MLRGWVNERGEPQVELVIDLGPARGHVVTQAVIDTGFNGYLSVPLALLRSADWELLGFEEYELASGEVVSEPVYWGRVLFGGEERSVYAVATRASDVLVGTGMLKGKVLTVDFGAGTVLIERSPGSEGEH